MGEDGRVCKMMNEGAVVCFRGACKDEEEVEKIGRERRGGGRD